jgi:hypothetical protein
MRASATASRPADVLAMAGMDTLELVSRLQRSDMDPATLDALRIMADHDDIMGWAHEMPGLDQPDQR